MQTNRFSLNSVFSISYHDTQDLPMRSLFIDWIQARDYRSPEVIDVKCSSWIHGLGKWLAEDQRNKETRAFHITGLKAQKIRVSCRSQVVEKNSRFQSSTKVRKAFALTDRSRNETVHKKRREIHSCLIGNLPLISETTNNMTKVCHFSNL